MMFRMIITSEIGMRMRIRSEMETSLKLIQ